MAKPNNAIRSGRREKLQDDEFKLNHHHPLRKTQSPGCHTNAPRCAGIPSIPLPKTNANHDFVGIDTCLQNESLLAPHRQHVPPARTLLYKIISSDDEVDTHVERNELWKYATGGRWTTCSTIRPHAPRNPGPRSNELSAMLDSRFTHNKSLDRRMTS
jgi:hypothetical protein